MEMQVDVADFDEGHVLVTNKYIQNWEVLWPEQKDGESAQAYKKRQEYGRGFRSALAECFEVYIAASRIRRYGKRASSIPVVPAFEVENTLFPAIDAGWTSAIQEPTIDKQLDFFWEVFEPYFESYMFPERLEEQDESFRRQHVLNGTEDPEPDDKKWLDKEAVELERRAADIRKRFDIR